MFTRPAETVIVTLSMLAVALLRLLFAVGVYGARRRAHRRVDMSVYDTLYTFVNVGTPPKQTRLKLDLKFSDLTLVDYDCHYPAPAMQCPRFCTDETMRQLFCRSICHRPSRSSLCADPNLRTAANSTTYKDLHEERTLTFRGYRPFFAHRAADEFQFDAMKLNKTVKVDRNRIYSGIRTVLDLENQPFVRGLSTEIREINKLPGILGLRPGYHSFVSRLKQSGHLGSAIVSLQRDYMITYSPSFIRSLSTMMFGVLDKSVCTWERLPAINREGWSFEITDVKFFGASIAKTSIARFEVDSPSIEIPQHVADHYVNAGVLVPRYRPGKEAGRDYLIFSVGMENVTALSLEFKFGDRLVELKPEMLLAGISLNTVLTAGSPTRYGDEAEWVFGTNILDHVCFGYDYDTGEVAWGWRRRPDLSALIL